MNKYITAKQIAQNAEHKKGIANIRAINSFYRAREKNPGDINNATNRAIRKVNTLRQRYGAFYGLEYCDTLEATLRLYGN